MANIIEITVTARNDTGATLAEVKDQFGTVGKEAGTQFSEQASGALKDGSRQFGAAGAEAASSWGQAFAADAGERAQTAGTDAGEKFTAATTEALASGTEAITSAGLAAQEGYAAGFARDAAAGAEQAVAATAQVLATTGVAEAAAAGTAAGEALAEATAAAVQDRQKMVASAIRTGLLSFGDTMRLSADEIDQIIGFNQPAAVAQAEEAGQFIGRAFDRGFAQQVESGLAATPFGTGFGTGITSGMTLSAADSGAVAGTAWAASFSREAELGIQTAQLSGLLSTEGKDALGGVLASGAASTATKAASAAGGDLMSSLMYGPMGMILWQLPWLASMFMGGSGGGLFGMGSPAQPSPFQTAAQTDQGLVGPAMAAAIQQAVAGSAPLGTLENISGLTEQQIVQAAAGDSTQSAQVNATLDALTAQANYGTTQQAAAGRAGGLGFQTTVAGNPAALEQVNAMRAALAGISQAADDAATKQAKLNAELIAVSGSGRVFNDTLMADYTTMQANAQQSAMQSVALLDLGSSQQALNMQLVDGETKYTEATQAASGYSTVLTSLNGTQMSLDQAQNTLAQDMLNAATSFKTNKDSLDLNTAAGVANRQALVSASQAIVAMGVAQYQSTGNMNDANAMIQQQINAYVKSTGATGKAKEAIIQYLDAITQIPPNVATNVTANTQPAQQQLAQLLEKIDTSSGTINVYENSSGQVVNTSMPTRAQAAGGVTGAAVGGPRNGWTLVGEYGPELADLSPGTTVMPNANLPSMLGGGWEGGAIPLEVQWVGGNAGDSLFQWLRQAIRIKGGTGTTSVQRALGMTY